MDLNYGTNQKATLAMLGQLASPLQSVLDLGTSTSGHGFCLGSTSGLGEALGAVQGASAISEAPLMAFAHFSHAAGAHPSYQYWSLCEISSQWIDESS